MFNALETLLNALPIIIVPFISFILKYFTDKISEQKTQTETKDIKLFIDKAKQENLEEIPVEIINQVELFWIKTRDRAQYEVDDKHTRIRCFELLDNARAMIETAKNSKNVKSIDASYEIIKYADTIINSLYSSKYYAAGLLAIFVVALITISSVTWNRWDEFLQIIVLGIPLPVLLWGAIGGATAPLYKYLGFRGRFSEDSFKSFILRPFIGILMGAFIYLVVKSGLIVFGNMPNPQVANPELLWVFAFIGGFSESLTGNVLKLIEGSVTNGKNSDTLAENKVILPSEPTNSIEKES